jgi:hypothetical protein
MKPEVYISDKSHLGYGDQIFVASIDYPYAGTVLTVRFTKNDDGVVVVDLWDDINSRLISPLNKITFVVPVEDDNHA